MTRRRDRQLCIGEQRPGMGSPAATVGGHCIDVHAFGTIRQLDQFSSGKPRATAKADAIRGLVC